MAEIAKLKDTFRSPMFYDYVRGLKRCCLCEFLGEKPKGPIDAHHLGGRGRAQEGSDASLNNVCRRKHHPQSPKAYLALCASLKFDPKAHAERLQRDFLEDQGYALGRDGETFEAILIEAGIGFHHEDLNAKISRGTKASKGKKISKLGPLAKSCGTPDNPLL